MKDIDGNHIYNSPPDIMQIIPATDWYVVYDDQEDSEDVVVPLACWVLIELVGKDGVADRFVDAIDCTGAGRNNLGDFCTEVANFKEFRYAPASSSVNSSDSLRTEDDN